MQKRTAGTYRVVLYLSVERRAWVLFDPQYVKVKSRLELGMRDVRLLETEPSGANESFVLGCFSRESLTDEGHLQP